MSDQTVERLGVVFGLTLILAIYALALWPVWGVLGLLFPQVTIGYWSFYGLSLCAYVIVRFFIGPR